MSALPIFVKNERGGGENSQIKISTGSLPFKRNSHPSLLRVFPFIMSTTVDWCVI
jgi:hypothetical protein